MSLLRLFKRLKFRLKTLCTYKTAIKEKSAVLVLYLVVISYLPLVPQDRIVGATLSCISGGIKDTNASVSNIPSSVI